MNLCPNTNCSSTLHRYWCLSLSKAFSASNDNIAQGVSESLDSARIWNRQRILSAANLPFIKPAWSGWISLSIYFSKRRAKTFEYNLMSQSIKEIGRKLAHSERSFPFLAINEISAVVFKERAFLDC